MSFCGHFQVEIAENRRNSSVFWHLDGVGGFSGMSAVNTRLPVDRDRFSAGGTGPALFFLRDEFPDAEILNKIEIFQHAHAVVCPVPFIKLP